MLRRTFLSALGLGGFLWPRRSRQAEKVFGPGQKNKVVVWFQVKWRSDVTAPWCGATNELWAAPDRETALELFSWDTSASKNIRVSATVVCDPCVALPDKVLYFDTTLAMQQTKPICLCIWDTTPGKLYLLETDDLLSYYVAPSSTHAKIEEVAWRKKTNLEPAHPRFRVKELSVEDFWERTRHFSYDTARAICRGCKNKAHVLVRFGSQNVT